MKVGSQIYSLREYIKTVEGVENVFEFLKKAQSETVELAAMPAMSATKLADIAKNNGVAIISSHNDLHTIRKSMHKLVADHLVYGAKYIGIGGMPPKYLASEKSVKKFAAIMNQAGAVASEYGLKMLYHNHAFEFEIKKGGKSVFDILLDNFSDNVAICLDCYWAYVAKQDVTKLISRIGSNLAMIHCKDYPEGGQKDGYKMVAPGRGILTYDAYLAASKRVGCEHALVELDESIDPKEELIFGIDYLKQL